MSNSNEVPKMNEKMLTIGVSDKADTKRRTEAAFKGKGDSTARFSFASRTDLFATLNANRWRLIEALTGTGTIGVRELARRVGRDVKGVHTDAQVLVQCGLIDKKDDGQLSFDYDTVRVEFALKAS